MISLLDLKARVTAQYPKAEVVGDATLRFIRESNGKPYAVCYFDLSEDMPPDEQKLSQYLDETIGPAYFEGEKSLQ